MRRLLLFRIAYTAFLTNRGLSEKKGAEHKLLIIETPIPGQTVSFIDEPKIHFFVSSPSEGDLER